MMALTSHFFRARLSKELFELMEDAPSALATDQPDSDPRVQFLREDGRGRFYFRVGWSVAKEKEVLDIPTMVSKMVKTTTTHCASFALDFKLRLIDIIDGSRSAIHPITDWLVLLSPDDFVLEDIDLDIRDVVRDVEDAGIFQDIEKISWSKWDVPKGRLTGVKLSPADIDEARRVLKFDKFQFKRIALKLTQPNYGAKCTVTANGSISVSCEDEEAAMEMLRKVIFSE